MFLYILLIIIAIGVLLASEAGQKLLSWIIGLGIFVIGLAIIAGVLIIGVAALSSHWDEFKNAFEYLAIIGAVIGVIAVIVLAIKDRIEMKVLNRKIYKDKKLWSDFEDKE